MREVKAHFDAPEYVGVMKRICWLWLMRPSREGVTGRRAAKRLSKERRLQFAARRNQFFHDEGAAVLIDSSRLGDGGTIFVQSATRAAASIR